MKSTWQDKGKHQKILGTDYITVESVSPIQNGTHKIVKFELRDNKGIWGMGPNTQFKIRGRFEFVKEPEDRKILEWENCTDIEVLDIVVQPNWFESHHKMIKFFHGQSKINSSS